LPASKPTYNPRYLALADVVERYGGAYSAWTLREKARRGELPHLKHPGCKKVLFREDWLDAYDAGCELEREVLRKRGMSPGRVVRPVKRAA
jgi:hypothetical protein